MTLEIARLDSKFEHLELKLTQQYSNNPKTVPPLEDDECCVIVQGLRQDSNEDIDSKVNKLVEAMGDTGLKINVKDSTRLRRHNPNKPATVKISGPVFRW